MGLFGPSKRELQAELARLEAGRRAVLEEEERKRQEDLVSKFHSDIAVIKEAIEPLKKIAENIQALDGMVQGLTAMCKVSADQLDEFKKVVEILERSMSSTEKSYDEYAEDTRAGQERLQASEIRDMMRQGMTEKEARSRVRERNIYEEMARSRRS